VSCRLLSAALIGLKSSKLLLYIMRIQNGHTVSLFDVRRPRNWNSIYASLESQLLQAVLPSNFLFDWSLKAIIFRIVFRNDPIQQRTHQMNLQRHVSPLLNFVFIAPPRFLTHFNYLLDIGGQHIITFMHFLQSFVLHEVLMVLQISIYLIGLQQCFWIGF
jgi:hypothetical protein